MSQKQYGKGDKPRSGYNQKYRDNFDDIFRKDSKDKSGERKSWYRETIPSHEVLDKIIREIQIENV